MNRPDKKRNKLSVTEKEIGGIPNSSEDIKQAHASAIEMYIQEHVGHLGEGNYGTVEQSAILVVRDYDGPDDKFSVATPMILKFGDSMFTSLTHDVVELPKK